jgi:hypothetical protein
MKESTGCNKNGREWGLKERKEIDKGSLETVEKGGP